MLPHEAYHASLGVIHDLGRIGDPALYRPLPADWWVAVSDVRASTQAIREGRYKEVNAVGSVSVMALLNLTGDFKLPFLFGGDGATVCLPGTLREAAAIALGATRTLAAERFGLDLRVGLVPVADIRAAGSDVLVARLRISDQFDQAVFLGGGLAWADSALKADAGPYELHAAVPLEAGDFSGFECRWEPIPTRHEEMITLMVESVLPGSDARHSHYTRIVHQMGELLGADELWRPITPSGLTMTFDPAKLSVEQRVRSADAKGYLRHLFKMNLFGALLMKFGIRTSATDWSRYKPDASRNTDFKKFDDMIRMVLSVTRDQREALEEFLEAEYRAGRLAYGIHRSHSALMTCLLFGYMKNHIHFVDGADGGYAEAARALKGRKAGLQNTR